MGYGGNPFLSVLARGYIKADRYFIDAENILKLQKLLVLLLLTLLAAASVRTGIIQKIKRLKNKRRAAYPQSLWTAATSYVLIISMIGSFSLTGCGPSGEVPGIEGGGVSEVTDTKGLPTEGTFYFHPDHLGSVSYITDLSAIIVPEGWPVFMGNIIGLTGNSGPNPTKKHLHFAIYLNDKPVDPRPYLNFKNKLKKR
jgi:hypothetical protein